MLFTGMVSTGSVRKQFFPGMKRKLNKRFALGRNKSLYEPKKTVDIKLLAMFHTGINFHYSAEERVEIITGGIISHQDVNNQTLRKNSSLDEFTHLNDWIVLSELYRYISVVIELLWINSVKDK